MNAPSPTQTFFSDWGFLPWLGASIVLLVVLVCGGVTTYYCARTARILSRQPLRVLPSGGGDSTWSFQGTHNLEVRHIEAVQEVLRSSQKGGKGKDGSRRRGQKILEFYSENELQAAHLNLLQKLVELYPEVSLCLDLDWRGANHKCLQAFAPLLTAARTRCKFRVPQGPGSPETCLRLPAWSMPSILGNIAEAVAVGSPELDALSLEVPTTSPLTGNYDILKVALIPLRLSCQEFAISRTRLGDTGCAVACGFMRTWSSRLQLVKLLDCEIGDEGASTVARLLLGGPAGGPVSVGLRELSLSANRIGNKGAADLADALPRLDSLERLLLDRNCIGLVGAKALAARLPRSNVRELVLGSHLGGNPIGPLGIEALAGALDDLLSRAAADRATRLGALALEDCGIGEKGAQALAKNLPKSALGVLSVARGDVTDAGAQAILDALPACMMSLDLAGNGLSDMTASVVGETFYRLPQVAVSLAQNNVSPTLRSLLAEEHGTRLRL